MSKSLFLMIFLFSSVGVSQMRDLAFQSDDKIKSAKGDRADGWYPELKIEAQYSLTKTQDVIGQQDGRSVTIGGDLASELSYYNKQHEWRNELDLQLTQSKTPKLPDYIKSADEIKFATIYLYSLEKLPWLGPYGRFSAKSSILKGEDVRSETVDYKLNGNTLVSGTEFELTDAFKPLTLKESIGAFAKIIDKKKEKLEARLGYGALQVYADGQFSIDSAEDGVVTLTALEDYSQSGIEAAISYKRRLDERTDLAIKLEALMPLDNSDTQNRSASELTNYDFSAKLTTKVYKMLSFSYEHRFVKQPQLLDESQTTDLLLFNFSYDVFGGSKAQN